ncbi:unnamed protein product [Phytomonas sp. Hart1]|nr:unnamed protein product [Phytomonas sp. Hart1]|eukprot:CCW70024.1 unnamed protein product [Phytomonas sp. isolate Hart1]
MDESSIFKDVDEEERTSLSNVNSHNFRSFPTSLQSSISSRCFYSSGDAGPQPAREALFGVSAEGGRAGTHRPSCVNVEGPPLPPLSSVQPVQGRSPFGQSPGPSAVLSHDLIYGAPALEGSEKAHHGPFGVAPTGRSDSDTETSVVSGPSSPQLDYPGVASGAKRQTVHNRIFSQHTGDTTASEPNQPFVDEFGFLLGEEARLMDQLYRKKNDGTKTIGLENKWVSMTADWDYTYNNMRNKLKERCRKGIPTKLRGVSWQLLIGSHAILKSPENSGVYTMLCNKTLKDKEVDLCIERDLARTFPNNILFQEEGGAGQMFLRNVLHAYAACDPEVGYTQGMAFLVGALATQMDEERSFWALHEMMHHERYRMRELFRPGFPMLKQFFYQLKRLLARLLPKLHERFEQLGVDPSFYASQWFMTLFVYHFPFHALLRIWDIFFSEGWKIVFRTSIALMKWEEKRLLSLPFEKLLPSLKSLQNCKDCGELLYRAHRVKFKTSELNKYGNEYWEIVDRSQMT